MGVRLTLATDHAYVHKYMKSVTHAFDCHSNFSFGFSHCNTIFNLYESTEKNIYF